MRPPPTPSRLLILCLLATMGGCASVDLPPAQATPAPKAETQRALPAWDALATELAERIANRLSELPTPTAPTTDGTPTTTAKLVTAPFHLSAPAGSPFDSALRTLFGQRLLSLGLTLNEGPMGSDGRIDVATQLIERSQRPLLLLVSTLVRAHGQLQANTADLYAIEAADLPLFIAPATVPPAVVKTWRMGAP